MSLLMFDIDHRHDIILLDIAYMYVCVYNMNVYCVYIILCVCILLCVCVYVCVCVLFACPLYV